MLISFIIFSIVLSLCIFLLGNKLIAKILSVIFLIALSYLIGYSYLHLGKIDSVYFKFDQLGVLLSLVLGVLSWATFYHSSFYLSRHNFTSKQESLYFASLIMLVVAMTSGYFAENIAGDTVIGHTSTFVQTIEALAGIEVPEQIQIERAIALELERIAIHTGDIAALCVDAAYQLGANVFGILRTPIINFTQHWCGNRLGKGLVRILGTHFPFTEDLKQELLKILNDFEFRFEEMAYSTYRLPSIQNRFEFVGVVNKQQAHLIGTVGLSARMSNIYRDIRVSHPSNAYQKFPYETVTVEKGDVYARFLLKKKEIRKSIAWIRKVLSTFQFDSAQTEKPKYQITLKPNQFVISLTEDWHGEICHSAITNENGELINYKVKDPSIHNWKALELSMRNSEISDFPINNKSYNLSYCGNDL